MALSVDWPSGVITIPKADLTLVSGSLYELDTDAFRLELKALEAAATEGITFLKTHNHNTEYTVAGVTYARAIIILAPYSVEFEDGAYSVRLAGSNNNIFDVEAGILVQNSVQVIGQNSAGLIVVNSGSGLTATEQARLRDIWRLIGGDNSFNLDTSKDQITIDDITIDVTEPTPGTTRLRRQ
jgi:hypothetical protein